MTSLTSFEIQREPACLRRAVQRDGEVVTLTFRGKPYGHVVPSDWYEQAAAALAREQGRSAGEVTAA